MFVSFYSLSKEVFAAMKRFFQKTKEQLIDSIANESDLNPQIYDHLNSVIKLDMNGNLVTYNQVFAKQYGYNEGDFTKPFLDVFIKYETLEQKHFFDKAILGKTQSFNYVYEQAEILLDKNGHLDGFIGFIQEIINSEISNHVRLGIER